jgi:8-oxo-dGTP pyrophosphatase MutT (NUDIX family)
MQDSSFSLVAGVAATALVAYAIQRYLLTRQHLGDTISEEALKALVCEGRGPFAPARPTAESVKAGKTEHGSILRVGPILLQRAQFNALWMRIGVAGEPVPPAGLLRSVVDAAIAAQSSGKRKAAVYVAISDACLESTEPVDLAYLRQSGFAFHHYRPATSAADHGESVHVCDLAKMVPGYATSIEGATGVVFSPDEAQVLGVWERGGWNTPGGAVDEGEDKWSALSRECHEEVGIKLDSAFNPVYLGGWQKGRARDGKINDNFSVFAVRAASKDFKVDDKEIAEAMWLPWRELLDEWTAAGKPTADKVVTLKHPTLPQGRALVSKNMLKWLDLYRSGKGMPCKLDGKGEVKIGA